jgi:hypothetical protein
VVNEYFVYMSEIWSEQEVDLIIEDYFEMLANELEFL